MPAIGSDARKPGGPGLGMHGGDGRGPGGPPGHGIVMDSRIEAERHQAPQAAWISEIPRSGIGCSATVRAHWDSRCARLGAALCRADGAEHRVLRRNSLPCCLVRARLSARSRPSTEQENFLRALNDAGFNIAMRPLLAQPSPDNEAPIRSRPRASWRGRRVSASGDSCRGHVMRGARDGHLMMTSPGENAAEVIRRGFSERILRREVSAVMFLGHASNPYGH